jgi:hypothetical protein
VLEDGWECVEAAVSAGDAYAVNDANRRRSAKHRQGVRLIEALQWNSVLAGQQSCLGRTIPPWLRSMTHQLNSQRQHAVFVPLALFDA